MVAKPGTHALSQAVAARVRSLRQQYGWSAQRLADQLRTLGLPISRGAIASIETGTRLDITVDELYAFAAVFDVTADQLVNGPACSTCNDAPPPGFVCLNCGAPRTTAGQDGDPADFAEAVRGRG